MPRPPLRGRQARILQRRRVNIALVTSSAPTANDAPIGDNCPVARSVACVLTVILSPISANKSSMPPSGLSRVTAYASIVDRVVRGSRCRSGQRHALPNVSTHTQMPAASCAPSRRGAGQQVGDRLPAHKLAAAPVLHRDERSTIWFGSTPAMSAVASSPREPTPRHAPSSATQFATAVVRSAFPA